MALLGIAIQMGIGLTLWGIGKLLEEDPPPFKRAEPGALRLPRSGVGTTIPIVYGDVYIDEPPLVWVGNRGVFLDAFDQWSYRGDFLFCLGIPASDVHSDWRTGDPPRLMAIWVNGVRHPLGFGGAGDSGIVHGDEQNITIDLGGEGRGGQCVGLVGFMDGRPDQRVTRKPDNSLTRLKAAMDLANAHLGVPIDENGIPGYRHYMTAYLLTSSTIGGGSRLGESESVAIGFEVRAYGATKVVTTGGTVHEANAATALYDLLCSRIYKLNLSTSLVDKTSFDDAAATLLAEGFGISPVLKNRTSGANMALSILDMINGVIVEDHATGKLKLKLIRDDYDPDLIPLITKNNLVPNGQPGDIGLEIDFFGWEGVTNELHVEFTDREQQWNSNHAVAQRGAVASQNGGRISSKTVKYPAVTSKTLASRLAARELALCSRPLMVATARVNRTLHEVEIGDALRMQVTDVVEDEAFRVIDIDHGQLADGVITLRLIEDVFGQVLGAYPPWGGFPPFEPPEEILDPG